MRPAEISATERMRSRLDARSRSLRAGPALLFLNGSGSTLARSGMLIDLFADRFDVVVPNAELRVYEGGHAFFVQDRDALPEILDFLAG